MVFSLIYWGLIHLLKIVNWALLIVCISASSLKVLKNDETFESKNPILPEAKSLFVFLKRIKSNRTLITE